jgi:hypothetical protein
MHDGGIYLLQVKGIDFVQAFFKLRGGTNSNRFSVSFIKSFLLRVFLLSAIAPQK